MPDDLTISGHPAILAAKERGFEVFDASNRDEWLALREKDVTASMIAGLFRGEHDYYTRLRIYNLKTGQTQDDPEETPAMRRGRLLEPVAIEALREDQPEWRLLDRSGKLYFRDPQTRIGATPDSIWIDPSREGFGIVQIKTAGTMAFRKKWQPDRDIPPEPPFWIAVQALTEAYLTGASWAAVYVMRTDIGVDCDLIDIPIHAGAMKAIKSEVALFWESVRNGEPPPADYSKDGKLLESMYELPPGSVVDLSGDNILPALAIEDSKLRDEAKRIESRRKEIKAEIIEKIGRARVVEENDEGPVIAMIDGQKFATSKTVHRKGYTVKESSYRDVRIVYKGEAA